MTAVDPHGDTLRQLLNLAANTVTPAPDGLDRIRAAIDTSASSRRSWWRRWWRWLTPRRTAATEAPAAAAKADLVKGTRP